MKILFMCLGTFDDLGDSSVHIDILKQLAKDHELWLVCKNEGKDTTMTEEYGIHVLRVHTGKLKNTGVINKGINTVLVEPQFTSAIKKHLSNSRFDLVLYTTPPITFANAVKYIKNRDGAKTYLMLKDIFPQNAVDLRMMPTSGIKGWVYRFFRRKEKELYAVSDYIGCMSPANERYILTNNPEITSEKVGVCPNSSVVEDVSVDNDTRISIREKYDIPLDKKVFVYGGNLGKPQGVPFLIECLNRQKESDNFFLIIGKGTEYKQLSDFMCNEGPKNCKLMYNLPKADYEKLVAACDVGMIFLDHRFTIPNFPSRLLSYMKARIPVLAVTDPNTDLGQIIEAGNFGWWCESNDVEAFSAVIKRIESANLKEMGNNAFRYLSDNYNVEDVANSIIDTYKKISDISL